jgi:uncharacterized protein (TIGR02996 family)
VTDRDQLLAAIRARPEDDVLRLGYADWLEEFGAGDRDAATVEFIRVACPARAGGRVYMPKAAYAWLGGNWPRLVPAAVAADTPPFSWNAELGVVDGGAVLVGEAAHLASVRGRSWRGGGTIRWLVRLKTPRPSFRSYSTAWRFSRGFCTEVTVHSPHAFAALAAAVAADQPLAVLVDTSRRPARPEAG